MCVPVLCCVEFDVDVVYIAGHLDAGELSTCVHIVHWAHMRIFMNLVLNEQCMHHLRTWSTCYKVLPDDCK